MRVLVTGATGLLGSHLVPLLKKYEVLSVSRRDGFDIRDRNKVFDTVSKSDVVIHLAAQLREDAKDLFEVNVQGTANVADACEELGIKLIFASTCGIYGDTGPEPADERRPPSPETPYELSKLLAEHVVLARNVHYTILRLPILVGKSRYWKSMRHMATRGFPIVDVGQKWQLLDIRDAASAFVHAMEKGLRGIYNVVHPRIITIGQLYTALSGRAPKKMPYSLAKLLFSLRVGLLRPEYLRRLTRNRLYSGEKFYSTGWMPKYDPLESLKALR